MGRGCPGVAARRGFTLEGMLNVDPIGLPGASLETLNEVRSRFQGVDLQGGHLLMVTDTQGHREGARYGAVVVPPASAQGLGVDRAVVISPSFGPRFGAAGQEALAGLADWAAGAGLVLRETVLPAGDFVRVLEEPDTREVNRLVAASNPVDAGIYKLQRRSD